MILVLDNYDSFTYNLVQQLGQFTADLQVLRNDALTVAEVVDLQPERIVISPGPGLPSEAGIAVHLIRELNGSLPILGICLGHQAIAEAYGGRIAPAPQIVHGKTTSITHGGDGIFAGVPSPFEATRYHSLVVAEADLPAHVFEVTARSDDGLVMAMQHRQHPVTGLQFHPESILTEPGLQIIDNFLRNT